MATPKDKWEGAIESPDVVALLEVLDTGSGDLLKLEREGQSRGRTALHVAAKSNRDESFALAKKLLDQLLRSQQEKCTDRIFTENSNSTVGKFSNFTIGKYISLVEKDSKKTAMELAKGRDQRIVEYIKDIKKRSSAHAKIDQDVSTLKKLSDDYDEGWFNSEDKAEREKAKTWLCKAIASRDCVQLLRIVEHLRSPHTEDPREEEFWKCKDEWGRTMLHVAAMQGDFPLAKRLLDRARGRNDREYVVAKDESSGLTAWEMANDIIGNRPITEYVTNTLELMMNEDYKHPCFFEAYPRTDWCMALASGDSFRIRPLLENNHRLLLETYKGCTVLHVAILCKDPALVKTVLDIFGEEKKISFGDSYFPSELKWEQMRDDVVAIDKSLFDVTRPQMIFSDVADRSSFTCSLQVSAKDGIRHKKDDNSQDDTVIAMDDDVQSLLNNYDAKPDVPQQPVVDIGLPEEYSKLESKINENWNMEWDKGYGADVDFNFEDGIRKTLLKVHYACKHPLVFQTFLKSVYSDETILVISLFVRDAQGRTAYHISMDYSDNENPFPGRWFLNEIFGNDKNGCHKLAQDARGRTLNVILLMKNYLQHNVLLENGKVLQHDFNSIRFSMECDDIVNDDEELDGLNYNPMNYNDYLLCFTFYLVATALMQTHVAQHVQPIIYQGDARELKKLFKLKELAFIAASTGNQVVLRLLDRTNLSVIDARKRTLLHHSADSTLLNFDVLFHDPMMRHWFSTVNDLCKVKEWIANRNKTPKIFPSQGPQKDFSVEKLLKCINMERKACILLLLREGIDLSQHDEEYNVPSIGPTDDVDYQNWWYDMVVRDFNDKKNKINHVINGLSVVGTLVAATSYIGPLQPPLTFTGDGFIRNVDMVLVFMLWNTVAFYCAMASVICAVVPSSCKPRSKSPRDLHVQLKWIEFMVRISLALQKASIYFLILSYSCAVLAIMSNVISFVLVIFFLLVLGFLLCNVTFIASSMFAFLVYRLEWTSFL